MHNLTLSTRPLQPRMLRPRTLVNRDGQTRIAPSRAPSLAIREQFSLTATGGVRRAPRLKKPMCCAVSAPRLELQVRQAATRLDGS